MLSEDINYKNYSRFVNDCINGYRNITYVKQQQTIDSSFTLKQAQTYKHTYIALNTVIKQALQLEKFLKESGFEEKQLLSFSHYLKSRYFDNCYKKMYVRQIKEIDIDAKKEIFDYIVANPNCINKLVSQEIIDEFQQQYKAYQEDAEKYGHETIEERRDRLNKERVAKGFRPVRFP